MLRAGSEADEPSRSTAAAGWKSKLRNVLATVEEMKPEHGAAFFPTVKDSLRKTVEKIIASDLANNDLWGPIHSRLEVSIGVFSGLQYFPGSVGQTFTALHTGLNSKFVKTEQWMQIKDRDAKIVEIMQSMGKAIQTIPDQNISEIIGVEGVAKMKVIETILLSD